jgi:hypothetical protein
MVKVFKNGQMDRNTKVCGLIITCMEKGELFIFFYIYSEWTFPNG